MDEVILYRTVIPEVTSISGKEMLFEGQIDIVTFTSSSTVKNFIAHLGAGWEAINQTTVACIGPITTATAIDLGIHVDVVAKEHTITGLVQTLIEYCQTTERAS